MKKWCTLFMGLVFCGAVLQTSAQTVVWEEDFEATFTGATSGNNQVLTNTVIQTANTASSIVTNPPGAFTLASGTNCILLSTGLNNFTAIRPNVNPITGFTANPTDTYEISFDIYIPSALAKAVGDVQPRLKGAGGGNGVTLSSMTQSGPGEFHIEYTGSVADILSGTPPGNNARPFIGIDQANTAVSDYMYMDNIYFAIIPPTSKIWNGNVNDNWTTAANFQGGLTYADDDDLLFDESLAGSGSVDLTSVVAPASVTISNGATTYAFNISGSGDLGGAAVVSKVGSGTATFGGDGTISYTGSTSIQAGELALTTENGGNSNSAFSVSGSGTLGIESVSGGSAYVSNLAVVAGSSLSLDFSTDTPSTSVALLKTAGTLSASGAATISVENGTGWTIGETYTLIEYTGTFSDFENLSIGTLPAGVFGQLVHDASAKTISLIVTPEVLATGSLVDTSFVTAEGYVDADLAGQTNWMQAANSSNNAFSVINSGTTGEADTATAGNHSTNAGNAVYWDSLTANETADAWNGYFDFKVSTVQSAGTNIALINNQDVLSFGITSDKDASHRLEGNANDQMALMSLKVRANGKLVAMFGEEGNDNDDIRLATLLFGDEAGWQPQAPTGTATYVSDTIRYTWQIRKTTEDGKYQATASLSNLTTGVAHVNTQVTTPSVVLTKQDMYDSPVAYFTMGHYYKAQLGADNELVDVEILAMSVSHSTNNLPAITPPSGITTLGGDRSVIVSWDATLEATDYDVLFGETSNGVFNAFETNTTLLTATDSPRFNGVTGYYKVRANFDLGSDETEAVAGTPIALKTQINIDGTSPSSLFTSDALLDRTTGLQTNGTVTYIDYTSTPFISTQGGWSGPPVYGLSQIDIVSPSINNSNGNGYRLRNDNGSNGTVADHIEFTTAGGSGEALWYVKEADWEEPGAVDITVDTHAVSWANKINIFAASPEHRIAIRNGTDWFVSETNVGDGNNDNPDEKIIPNLFDEKWAPLTVAAGTLMTHTGTFTTNDNATFTDVNAIGWWADDVGKWKPYKLVYSSSGSIPSVDYWMNQYASVSNLTDNTDGDDLSNIKEYAFGGDPEVADAFADGGGLPEFSAATVNGSNGFIFVSVELRDPAPGVDYSLETTDNLPVTAFAPDASIEQIGSADINYYYRSVTNFVPADDAVKFIDMKVTETP